MSKDIVPETVEKEHWMTEELQDKLNQFTPDGKISCAQVQRFAQYQSIELKKMKLLNYCFMPAALS